MWPLIWVVTGQYEATGLPTEEACLYDHFLSFDGTPIHDILNQAKNVKAGIQDKNHGQNQDSHIKSTPGYRPISAYPQDSEYRQFSLLVYCVSQSIYYLSIIRYIVFNLNKIYYI